MSVTNLNRNDPCACGSGKKYKKCCLPTAKPVHSPIVLTARQAEEMLDAAIAHQKAGRLAQAEELYRQLLQTRPDLPDPPHLLGVIAHLRGEHRQAAELIEKAIALRPTAAMYGNLAAVNIALGNLESAAELLKQGLQLDPKHADCLNNLGYVLKSQGKLAESMDRFLEAIAHKPDHAGAYSNLGNAALDMGQYHEAIRCYQVALSIKPDDFATRNSLGVALKETGDMEGAIREFEQVLATNPQFALAYNNLGNVARDLGQPELAIEFFRKTLALDPSLDKIHSNLLFAMLTVPGYSQDELFAEHLRFAQQFEAPLKPFWASHGNVRNKHKRLKIGYVSGDFRSHAVAYFFEPVLATHDKSQVEIFSYYNNHQNDEVSRRFAALSDHWIPCYGWSDEALAARIREDGIDILIDLSSHTRHNRLLTFARKPAPIQMTWIGYPTTTGLTAIDYRLTDAIQDPPGMTERYHTETLLRLPATSQFKPVPTRPPVNALPALTQGQVTFACLNNLAKVSDEVIGLWGQILSAVPRARLMLGNVNALTRQRLVDIFAKYGTGEDRLVMHQRMPLDAYLALHQQIDLALDSFPYTGGTTSYHALSMGVPVLTLAGDSAVSRCGAGIMINAGLPEFVVASKEEYVQRAIDMASDLPRLARIREALSQGTPNLYDPRTSTYAQDLERIFRQVWEKWCDSSEKPAQSSGARYQHPAKDDQGIAMFDLSIFIPTHYAGPRHYTALMQACEFARTNKNIEVVVSDNSGDPGKLSFLRSFASENFKVVEGPLAGNYLFALEQTSGRYVLPMGDDDYLLPAAIPALLDDLRKSHGFIGAAGLLGRELGAGYDFYPLNGLDSPAFDTRVSGVLGLLPVGNPSFHTIVDRDVLIKAFKFWHAIPNFQAYHDHIVTLYVACAGPLLLMNQPYFIYNFENWGPEVRVESEMRYARQLGMPVSIVLIQRLMLAVEGSLLISLLNPSSNREQRQLAATNWIRTWIGAWRQALGQYVRTDIISCPHFLHIETLAKKYASTNDFAQVAMLEDIAKLYDTINGSGNDYRNFWLHLGA